MTELEAELGMTVAEYRALSRPEQIKQGEGLTPEQRAAFSELIRKEIHANFWKQRNEGTYPHDMEVRAILLKAMAETPIDPQHAIMTFGLMFEDYITTYPVNVSGFREETVSIGAYGGILNFQLLGRAIDEILEVAFDKFGFMLEYMQTYDYLSPTFGMITSTMRRKMPEYA